MPWSVRRISFNRRNLWPAVLVAIGLALAVQNFEIVGRNRDLHRALETFTRPRIVEGDRISVVAGVDVEGRYHEWRRTDDRKVHVLIGMSIHCPYSRTSLPAWKRLANLARQRGAAFTIVSRDFVRDLSDTTDVELPAGVLASPSRDTYVYMRLQTVPSTIIVDQQGNVMKAWVGELDDVGEAEMTRYIESITESVSAPESVSRNNEEGI